jgi:hypothetical protein
LFLVKVSSPLALLAEVLWKIIQDWVVEELWCVFLSLDEKVVPQQ